MFNYQDGIKNTDPELWGAMSLEVQRQEDHVELIASENYTSPAVLEAQGSLLTNKYAEGYPSKRYYGGCEFVDQVEVMAINRAKTLFGAESVNVQPHSGSQANAAVYMSVLKPGDTVLGMSLADGGHLTHGSPVNFSGKIYNFVSYGLDSNEVIDYAQLEALAHKYKPKMIVAGASAYSLFIDWARISEVAKDIGAYFLVDMAHYSGLIAAKVYPTPVGIADFVTSTTHKTLRGPRGGIILSGSEHEKRVNSSIFPGNQGGPLMHVIAGKAVAFKEALTTEFVAYQKQVISNAKAMANVLTQRGVRIVSGGTDSHMFLVDLRGKKITGKLAENVLGSAHITVNKNAIPDDPESPFVTSGIRIGSPALTTRGFGQDEASETANLIADVLDHPEDTTVISRTKDAIKSLCKRYPVYG
ncbi:MAG TPA: serine hydroxymethyltransferase [Betaproteobacteria bacterium]|nr:serine hydroxymethyltransferase [Betaproteobacteria bacterium]